MTAARLRELSRLADLRAERRLDTKVDLGAEAVTRRLRRQSALRALCSRLRAAAPTEDPGGATRA